MSQEELVTFPADIDPEIGGQSAEESHYFNKDGSIEADDFHILQDDSITSWGHSSNVAVTSALDYCRKYILIPYNGFLKVIGWRKFGVKRDRVPCCINTLNVVYPLFIFTMLMFACASQLTSCFSRSRSHPPTPIEGSKYSILQCSDHTVTGDMLLFLSLLCAYWGAFYIFRFSEAEHLSSLSETVFVSFKFQTGDKKWTRPVLVLIGYLVSGIVWFIFSGGVNILRLFSLGLHKGTTIIEWFTTNTTAINQPDYLVTSPGIYSALHYLFISCSLFGFIFFDFLYIAVIINYCLQCQLLTFYVNNIRKQVLSKNYKSLHEACKELFRVYEFLKVLNGKMAYITTLIMFICAYNVVASYKNLASTRSDSTQNIVLGFLNTIQWLLALTFPVVMATRFTAVSRGLRSLGLQIASRPFVYAGTSDLELQFFMNFASTTKYKARLAFIPMHPPLVLGCGFILLLLLSLGIGIPRVESINWF